MFDIIRTIIDHTYESSYSGDQQYIYYTCCCLIIIGFCVLVDLIYRIFRHFWHS